MNILSAILCALLALCCDLTRANNQCTAPKTCNPAQQCPSLYAIASHYKQASTADRTLLIKSKCGQEGNRPLLCCEPQSVASRNAQNPITEQDFPKPGECGANVKDRIVGGRVADITDFRWMALIKYNNTKKSIRSQFLCGGSLIHKNYVLTAAHCLKHKQLTQYGWFAATVRLGEHDISKDRDCAQETYESDDNDHAECAAPVEDVAIGEHFVHEEYDDRTKFNDIALIRLERPVSFTYWVKPVCLPFAEQLRNKVFDDITLVVAGFGVFNQTGGVDQSSFLKRMVEVNGANWHQCEMVYRTRHFTPLSRNQLCAGGVEGQDSCKGDSGGPLMGVDRSDATLPYLYLAGLVSHGPSRCGTKDSPGIYTRVDKYLDWIMGNMRH